MKKVSAFILSAMLGVLSLAYGQQASTTPEGFKYQASLRNSQGEVIADKLVSIRISIMSKGMNLKGGNSETVYSEVHTVSTNKLGMVSFEIGSGTLSTGNFSAISWGSAEHFVQIEIDETGGDSYKILGTSQLMSVPYSLHAKMASDVMPGSITIQNEIAARKEADEVLQSQVTILRGILNSRTEDENDDRVLGGNGNLGLSQDLDTLKMRYMADSASKNIRINNNLTRFTNDSAAKNTRINNNLTRFMDDSVAVRGLITILQNNLQTQITNNLTRFKNDSTALRNLIAAETARAIAAEASLSTNVTSEALRASGAEAMLDARITAEQNRAGAVEAGLRSDLDAEINRSASVDASQATTNANLQTAITNEAATARAAEQANATAITNETSRATTAETTLDGKITTEKNRAEAAEAGLAGDIATASSTAAAATAIVQANLDAEITRATNAEQANAAAVTNEAVTARAAEAGLAGDIATAASNAASATATVQGNLNAETARAEAAEQANAAATATVQSNLNAEAATARAAETALATAITDEATRATAAEQANATAISDEATAARAAESGLDTRVTALEATDAAQAIINADQAITNTNLQTAIAAETARALAAEAALAATAAQTTEGLQEQITAEVNRSTGVDAAQALTNLAQTQNNAAQAAEIAANAAAITAEAATARTAETALATQITGETNRATGVEAGLNTRVTALEATDAQQATINANQATTNANQAANNTSQANSIAANATAITNETNRATAAEATKWSNTGNAGTNANTNFIGTTDNVDLVAKTNNQERLRIKSSGQVEINTTTGSLLLPRLTTTQRDALTVAAGMTIYNTTTNKFQGYSIGSGTESLDQSYQNMWDWLNTNNFAQSFTAGTTGTLSKIAINTAQYGTGIGTYTLNIRNGAGQNGTILSTQTVTLTNTTGEQSFSIAGSAVNVTSGSQYTLEFVRTSGSPIAVYYAQSPAYNGGSYFYNGLMESWNDLNFKTYVTSGGSTAGWQDMPGASAASLAASEAGMQTQITNNLTRFKNDSTAVRGLITTETNRAMNVENVLRTDVNTATNTNNSQATAITSNATAITTETNRATAAEATKWGNTGNAGTNASTNFIGTTDNADLVAKTNNVERLRIKASGQVEINTTTGSLLMPRLTTAQRDALTPTAGMTIYNTTSNKFQGYIGGTGNTTNGTLDQSYQNQNNYNGGSWLSAAQSFTAGATGTLSNIAIGTQSNGTLSVSGTYTLNIRSGSGQYGTILSTQTVTLTNTTGDQIFPITGSTVNVISGTQYTLEFISLSSGNNIAFGYGSDSPGYVGGNMYLYGSNYSSNDLSFKTFIGSGSSNSATGWQDMPGASVAALTATEAGMQTQVTNNLTRFKNDSTAVRGLITTETNRATNAENNLSSSVSTETNRATNVENGLRTDVNTATSVNNSQATAITANANAITAETNRATAAEATKWGNTGNAGTNAGTNFIGTTDNIDLVAKTNNQERLRIKSSGQVEINTTTGSLLMPRLTTAQRDALTPVAGMTIYNATTNKFQGYVATLETPDQTSIATTHSGPLGTYGQSFTPGTTGNLTKIGLNITYAPTTSNFTFKLKSGTGTGATTIYTQAITISTTGEQTFPITGAINLTSGTLYSMWFEKVSGSDVQFYSTDTNPYANGNMFQWSSYPTYHDMNTYDYAFTIFIGSSDVAGWKDMPGASAADITASAAGLQSQITAEVARATNVENGLRTDVNTATNTNNSQATSITNLQAQVGSGTVDSRIAAATANSWTKSGNSAASTDFIGTTNAQDVVIKRNNVPSARIYTGGATVWSGDNSGVTPVTGAGARMMWVPEKKAFRAGEVQSTQWDNTSIGYYSSASGYNTIASGNMSTATGGITTASGFGSVASGYNSTAGGSYSVAIGLEAIANGNQAVALGSYATASGLASTALGMSNTASGQASTAMGQGNTASGNYSLTAGASNTASATASTAMGQNSTASGEFSIAMGLNSQAPGQAAVSIGYNNTASGEASTAFGRYTISSGYNSTTMGMSTQASGYASTAMGSLTTASGAASTAMGQNTTASGDNTTAMGSQVSTNGQQGSFIIGDNSATAARISTAPNQYSAFFTNGYRLMGGAVTAQNLSGTGTRMVVADANGTLSTQAVPSFSGWGQTGNSAASTDFIGTTNAQDLVTKTNNTERMRVTSAGEVNISGPVAVNTTTGGFVLPRLTTAQRNALVSPVAGTTVFNITTSKFQGCTGTTTGTEAVDQSSTNIAASTGGAAFGQSFVAATSGLLTKIQMNVYSAVSGTYSLMVYSGAGTSGTQIGTTISGNAPSGTGVLSFNLTDVNLIAGNTYTFHFTTSTQWGFWLTNNYANGFWYINNQPVSSYDMYFNTFITPNVTNWVDLH
ncbi:MAG: hypothetical protein V4642_06345 [Bacteroidota bacterium]